MYRKIILLFLVLTLSGCEIINLKELALPIKDTKIKKLKVGLHTTDTLNPLRTNSEDYYIFSNLIYEGLFSYDREGNIKKELVEEFELREDSIKIILKDKKFHNGSPLTSKDILFTIKVLQYAFINYKEDFLSPFFMPINNIGRVEIINGNELIINFKSPFAFNKHMLTFPILSEKDFPYEGLQKYEEALLKENFKLNGTGVYAFNEEIEGGLRLSGLDGALVEELDILFFENDTTAEEAFAKGVIDIWKSYKKNIDKLQKSDKIYMLAIDSNQCDAILFNQESQLFQGMRGKDFRFIIKSLLNQEEILRKIYSDKAREMYFPLTPNFIEDNSKSIDEIKNMLEAFEDSDGDGFLEDAEGKKLFLRIVVNDDDYRLAVVNILKEKLAKVGIDMEVIIVGEGVESFKEGEYYNIISSMPNLNNIDLLYIGVEFSPIPEPYFFSKLSQNLNSFTYNDSIVIKMKDDYMVASDEEERQKLARELADYYDQSVPYLFLTLQKHFIYSNTELKSMKGVYYFRWLDILRRD